MPATTAEPLSQKLPKTPQKPTLRPAPQILIVDDHTIVAQALASLVELRFGLQATLASSTSTALELARRHRFAMALLDLELADGHGLTVAETLSREQPDCALIVVSGHVDHLYCPPQLRRRLTAVIDKAEAFHDLSTVLEGVLKQATAGSREFLGSLTPREADVYRLMGAGLSCKEIAADLELTVRTVETHRKHIASKLGISGAALVHRATLDELGQRLASQPDQPAG